MLPPTPDSSPHRCVPHPHLRVKTYERSGKHKVEYADGEVEVLDLSKEVWQRVEEGGAKDAGSSTRGSAAEGVEEQGTRAAKRPRR